MTEEKKARGGKREGSGRKKGVSTIAEVRKARTLRATNEEWKIIKDFANNLKKINKKLEKKY